MTTTVSNAKNSEVENKIPDITNYITTQEFIKLTAEDFAARLKQTDFVKKNLILIVKKQALIDELFQRQQIIWKFERN